MLVFTGAAAVLMAAGPEPIDHAVNARIRAEARDRSQIMRTLHVLTDVHGPRLTGSPNHKAAAEWAVAEMKAWGFDRGQLEPWEFGHPGWLNERLSAHVVAPVKEIFRTSGCETSSFPTVGPSPGKTCSTSGGKTF